MSQFHSLALLSRRAETARAQLLEFALPPELAEGYRAQAGQHVVLRAARDGVELRRTYSVCSQSPRSFSICVRADGGGRMSGWLCGLQPGQSVDVLPPTGRFVIPPAAPARRVLAIAAGIGITPILAIVRRALESADDAEVTLLYGSRSTDDTLFAEALQALKDRHPARLALHFFMSREPQDISLYHGRIDEAKIRELARAGLQIAGLDGAFLCAPEGLMQEASRALQNLGLPAARIHLEHFVSAAAVQAARPAARTEAAGAGTAITGGTTEAAAFAVAAARASPAATGATAADRTRVSVRMDGRVRQFDMPREGELSVLDAAAEAGLDLPFSCKGGVCSTCRCHLSRGAVRMLQNYALEDAEVEAGYILTCQSIPTSAELELDYDKG